MAGTASKTSIANFMNQKSFHPSSFANMKKVWIAEEKAKADARKKKERDLEYRREQSIHETKGFALMTKEETDVARARHAVNFMYDAPPGMQREKDEDEPLKLDQSRHLEMDEKFAALKNPPRESYAKDLPARDQPFGVQVRNVRCLRCNQWGHQHVDRACPMFGKAALTDTGEAERPAFEDPVVLMRNMQNEEGLALTKRALGRSNDPTAANQQLLPEEDDYDLGGLPMDPEELEFLNSLSEKEKKKLLKKLDKLERGGSKKDKKKKKHKRHHHDEESSKERRRSRSRSPPRRSEDRHRSDRHRDDSHRSDRSDDKRRHKSDRRERSRSRSRDRNREKHRRSDNDRDSKRRSPERSREQRDSKTRRHERERSRSPPRRSREDDRRSRR